MQDKLEFIADKLAGSESSKDLESKFSLLLSLETDIDKLYDLSEKYTPYPHIAIPILERILEIDSNHKKAYIRMIASYYLAGEDDAARKILKELEQIHSEDSDICSMRAMLAESKEEEIKWYLKALDYDPGDLIAQINLGCLYWRRGEHEKAQYYLERSLETAESKGLLQDTIWANYRLGSFLFERGNYGKAEEYLRKVVKFAKQTGQVDRRALKETRRKLAQIKVKIKSSSG